MIPKFRVFAKAGTKEFFGGGYDTDQMFYEISEIDYYNKTVTVWGCHRKDCGMCDDTYKIEDVEVLMSTRLKDKNGVEIYEGDIVEIKQQDPIDKYIPNNSVNEIVYKDSAFCVKETWGIGGIEWPIIAGLYYKVSEEFEVIGNIYENPELLEVTE